MFNVGVQCFKSHLRFVKTITGVSVVSENSPNELSSRVYAELGVSNWSEFITKLTTEFNTVRVERCSKTDYSIQIERN